MFARMMTIPARVVMTALGLVLASSGAAQPPAASPPSKRMPDGSQWTTKNLNVTREQSYCYDNSERNCRQYGRLYTWESALGACRALGGGWRLPTNEEWRQMANHYGGIRQEAADLGKAAYTALITGGSSGFDAVHGGGRTGKSGEYERLDAHGFYWSATESDRDRAWFYNFGKGGQSVGRHENGEKFWALSVRCVKE
jgi:uncharacterized protein (TIGR02145 family)